MEEIIQRREILISCLQSGYGLECWVVGGESDVVGGSQLEEEGWREGSFDVKVVLAFWEGLEEFVVGG